jgi:membrane protease YdiL (CAAX protease family)
LLLKKWSNLLLKQQSEAVSWTATQAFWGIIATILLFFFVAVAASFLPLIHIDTSVPLTPSSDLAHAIATFFYDLVAEGIFLIVPFYMAYRFTPPSASGKRRVWSTLGFRGFDLRIAALLVLVFFAAIFILNEAYSLLISVLHLPLEVNSQEIYKQGKIAPLTTYTTLVLATIYAPFCEEIFFRSFSFMGLKNGMSLVSAIFLSALIFAAAHFDPASFPVLFFIGLALAIARWRTKSIWPGIILHLLNNGLSAVLVVLALHGMNV